MISGAEGPNFWKLAKAAAAVSIQPHGGDLWFGDAPFVHTTGGNIDTITTVRGKTLTDGGSSSRRPSYAEPAGTWNGSTNSLDGAANTASGAGAFTHLLEAALGNTASHFFSDYGPSTARSGVVSDIGATVGSVYELQGAAVNEATTTTTGPDAVRAVRVIPVDNSLGTAAIKAVYRNGIDVKAGFAASGDMTGKTLGAGNWCLGNRAFDPTNATYAGAMTASAGGIVLAAMSSGEAAAYTNAIRILRNL